VAPGMRLTLGIVGLFLVGVISASPAASNNTSGPKPISPGGHQTDTRSHTAAPESMSWGQMEMAAVA
jgi:hypothetical protein